MKVEDWAARIQWRGSSGDVSISKLPNKVRAAAAKGERHLHTTLVGAGLGCGSGKSLRPEMQRKSVSTVGDFSD